MTYKALLIDWAGTITCSLPEMVLTAAAALELTPDEMSKAFSGLASYLSESDSILHQAERGEIDDAELRAWIDGLSPGAGRLFDPDQPGIFQTPDRPEMIALMADARAAGLTVVVATNNFASADAMLQTRYIDSGVADHIVNSASIGIRKPDEAFFDASLAAAACLASEAVFFDDMQRNTDAAAALGIDSVLVSANMARAITDLRTLLGLV